MSNDKYIDLLIIGKTGNGKSATGNSILMRNAFKCIGSASSVTQTAKREYSKYKGRKIRAVDSPDFGETRLEGDESKKMVMKALKKAIMMSSDGYHAFLIALKFGNRFTKEEEDTIQFLKDVFGPNVVRDHCILVMPCGDYFTAEHEGTGVTFDIWCNHQCGSMYSLIEECQGRIVLFDNKTKDAKVKEQQLDKLLDYVDSLGGRRYTDQNFEEAKEVRKRILVEAKKPIISEKIREKTSLIIQKIEQIQNSTNESKNQEKLQKLSKKCDKLIKAILFEDKGTGIIHDLLDSVKGLKSTTENEIKFNEKLMKEREESMKKEEAMKQAEAEEKQRMKHEFEQKLQETKLKNELKVKEYMDKKIEEFKEERKRLLKEKEVAEEKYRSVIDSSDNNFIYDFVDWIIAPLKFLGRCVHYLGKQILPN